MNYRVILLVLCAWCLPQMVNAQGAEVTPVQTGIVSSEEKIYDWTGSYAGIEAGAGFGNSRSDFSATGRTTGNVDTTSFNRGFTAGYNQQSGWLVLGLEGDILSDSVEGKGHAPNPHYNYTVENNWLVMVRPRMGYAFDNVMPFVTGGIAAGNVHDSIYTTTGRLGEDFSHTELGYTMGAGVETALSDHWSVKAEYLYLKLNGASEIIPYFHDDASANFNDNIFLIGLNYRLDNPDAGEDKSWNPSHASSGTPISLSTLTGIEVGGQISDYRYWEDLPSGSHFIHDDGAKFGITTTATQSFEQGAFITADARLAYGQDDYYGTEQGVTYNGVNPSLKKRHIPEYLGEIRLLGGQDFVVEDTVLSPYAGIGYRNFFYDGRGLYTASSGGYASGYRRDSQYLYMPVGITERFRVAEDARISVNAEYDQLLEGWQATYNSDFNPALSTLRNDQSGGYGLRGSIMYERAAWSAGPFVDYWNINASGGACTNNGTSCGIEPHNQTLEYGLQARYRFE